MVGYKTQIRGRGQGYENLGIVYLEMALKALRSDETTRKRVQLGNRREPSACPVQLEIRKTGMEQRRQRSSNKLGEGNKRVPGLKRQAKVWGIRKEMLNGVNSC